MSIFFALLMNDYRMSWINIKLILRWKKALSWSQGLKMWKSAQSFGKAQNTLIFPSSLSTLTGKLDAPKVLVQNISLDKHLLNVCKKIRVCDGQGMNIWFECFVVWCHITCGVSDIEMILLSRYSCHMISDSIGRHGPNNLGDTVGRTIRAPWDCW